MGETGVSLDAAMTPGRLRILLELGRLFGAEVDRLRKLLPALLMETSTPLTQHGRPNNGCARYVGVKGELQSQLCQEFEKVASR